MCVRLFVFSYKVASHLMVFPSRPPRPLPPRHFCGGPLSDIRHGGERGGQREAVRRCGGKKTPLRLPFERVGGVGGSGSAELGFKTGGTPIFCTSCCARGELAPLAYVFWRLSLR